MSNGEKITKTIDFWRWRHRDAGSGIIRRTMFQLTPGEDGVLSEARALETGQASAGAAPDLELDFPEFAETRPQIGRLED